MASAMFSAVGLYQAHGVVAWRVLEPSIALWTIID